MKFDQIQAARERLRGHAHVTPVMTSRTLDERCGAQVFLKCENLQRVGAFKFRGAFNAISQVSAEQKRRGVVTHSSGNHAQAVALVGRLLGVKTTVVMPHNAPAIKRQATEGYGATIVGCEAAERELVAWRVQAGQGSVLVPPFDHEDIIAGQGTATCEFIEQAGPLDVLLVPVGGGGLISGSALAAKHLCPNCRVIGVEPELGDDAARSFRSRMLQTIENCLSIADGTRTRSLGKLTFPIILKNVDDFITISEEAIMEAVRFLFFRMKIVVEPSGALGVAALLSGAWKGRGRVGVILSGGNMDAPTMTRILAAG
jgi:threo-3-hydroxy-L-aspartate ammonia-lyase